jgi:hypothetical protein
MDDEPPEYVERGPAVYRRFPGGLVDIRRSVGEDAYDIKVSVEEGDHLYNWHGDEVRRTWVYFAPTDRYSDFAVGDRVDGVNPAAGFDDGRWFFEPPRDQDGAYTFAFVGIRLPFVPNVYLGTAEINVLRNGYMVTRCTPTSEDVIREIPVALYSPRRSGVLSRQYVLLQRGRTILRLQQIKISLELIREMGRDILQYLIHPIGPALVATTGGLAIGAVLINGEDAMNVASGIYNQAVNILYPAM